MKNKNKIILIGIGILIILLFSNLASACYDASTPFSYEALLNKPESNYDLNPLTNAGNVTLKTKEIPINPKTGKELEIKEHWVYANGTEVKIYDDGTTEPQETKTITEAIIYRSHHNNDIAVILSEVDDENLKGLSVKLQVSAKPVSYPQIEMLFEPPEKVDKKLNLNESFLEPLGYEIEEKSSERKPKYGDRDEEDEEGIKDKNEDERFKVVLTKENIYVRIWSTEGDKSESVWWNGFVIIVDGNLTPELEEELKSVITSFGMGEEEWNGKRIETREVINYSAIDDYMNNFDFKTAIKTELEWLQGNNIISGISKSDIQEISEAAKAGLAGYNSRVVWDNGWKSYKETGNSLLRQSNSCGGIAIGAGDLPEGEIILSPISKLQPPQDSPKVTPRISTRDEIIIEPDSRYFYTEVLPELLWLLYGILASIMDAFLIIYCFMLKIEKFDKINNKIKLITGFILAVLSFIIISKAAFAANSLTVLVYMFFLFLIIMFLSPIAWTGIILWKTKENRIKILIISFILITVLYYFIINYIPNF